MPHVELDLDARPVDVVLSQTQWNQKDLIAALPGARWDAHVTPRTWRMPLTWASLVALRGTFGDALTLGDLVVDWAWSERRNRVDPAMTLRLELSCPDDGDLDPRLYEFQRVGVRWLNVAGNAILGDEMGTGKTIQVCALLAKLHTEALPALVICPNGVKTHWERHIKNWTKATPYNLVGGTVGKRKILASGEGDPFAVVIVNIESVRLLSRLAPYGSIRLRRCVECDPRFGDDSLSSSRCEVHPKELNGFGFKTVVLDEAHRIKAPQARQTRAIWATMHDPSVLRRLALTGTPIANHPGDLWSVMHALEPREYPGKTRFVERYALTAWNAFGGLDIVGLNPQTREEFFRFFDPRFRRMTKAMVLPQLPPKIRTTRVVDMTPAQAKMYRELDRSLATRDANGVLLIAPSNLVAATRLSQLALSSVSIEKPDPDDVTTWKVQLKEPSPKLDELELVIEELGDRRFVVAAEYKQIIMLAAARLEKLKISYGLITGDQSNVMRDQYLDAFQRGAIRALLFTTKAGGIGLDMSASDTLINIQHPWSLVEYKQTEDRVHRIGSDRHESINVIDIITRGTIEEDKIRRLREKLERLEEITRDRANLAKLGRDTSQLEQEETQLMQAYLGTP